MSFHDEIHETANRHSQSHNAKPCMSRGRAEREQRFSTTYARCEPTPQLGVFLCARVDCHRGSQDQAGLAWSLQQPARGTPGGSRKPFEPLETSAAQTLSLNPIHTPRASRSQNFVVPGYPKYDRLDQAPSSGRTAKASGGIRLIRVIVPGPRMREYQDCFQILECIWLIRVLDESQK